MLGAYTDWFETLLQLSTLLVILESTINQMFNHGSQVDQLLSQPIGSMPRLLIQHDPSSSTSEEVLLNKNHKAFYKVMKFVVSASSFGKGNKMILQQLLFFIFFDMAGATCNNNLWLGCPTPTLHCWLWGTICSAIHK
jgi:hypothetical protein